jgi:hypothetical protein
MVGPYPAFGNHLSGNHFLRSDERGEWELGFEIINPVAEASSAARAPKPSRIAPEMQMKSNALRIDFLSLLKGWDDDPTQTEDSPGNLTETPANSMSLAQAHPECLRPGSASFPLDSRDNARDGSEFGLPLAVLTPAHEENNIIQGLSSTSLAMLGGIGGSLPTNRGKLRIQN